MNKYVKGTLWVGLCALTTVGLSACNKKASAEGPQYATVVSSTPIKKTVNHPHQECHNKAVTVHEPVQDQHQIIGTTIGAVVGGALGNQVGDGDGQKLATVAGAVAGGYAGHEIQENRQENATKVVTRRVCNTVNNPTTKVVGYNVKYKVDGKVHTTRMDHDPGARVEIQQGVSVVGSAK